MHCYDCGLPTARFASRELLADYMCRGVDGNSAYRVRGSRRPPAGSRSTVAAGSARPIAARRLAKAAASQLSDLPSAIDTELRPPAIVLDASKSANGAEVMAVCTCRVPTIRAGR